MQNTITTQWFAAPLMLAFAAMPVIAAQAPPPPPVPQQAAAVPPPSAGPQPVIIDARLRPQLTHFELAIQDAIDTAGARLAQWAESIVGTGSVYLVPAAPPKVSGMLLPDDSLAFDVHLAEMNVQGLVLLLQQQQQQPLIVNADPKMTATGVVKDDPVKSAGKLNPHQQYSDLVREVLLDILVDHGWKLPVSGEQWLTIQVTPIDVLIRDPIYRNRSRRLSLSVKGADLEAFKAKTLTREELRLRIVDRRF
jgi:hypothetical protein